MFKGVETENITMDLLITSALRMFYSCKRYIWDNDFNVNQTECRLS